MELKERLKEFMQIKNYSARTIGKQIGYSASTITRYINGNYEGDVEKLEYALQAYLKRMDEIDEEGTYEIMPFVPIENTQVIFTIARICHNEQEIGVVVGEAGTGKTRAIYEYAKQNPDVILIEADLSYTTKIFFRELHKKLGLDGNGSIYDLFCDCVDKLKNSNRLLIIDEAENLPYRALDMMRRLYDKSNIGILLVGLPRLIANLRGKKGEYKQLYSRVGLFNQIDAWEEEDTKMIISKIYQDASLTKIFHQLSKGNGRKLEKLIKRTTKAAKQFNKPITQELVKSSAEILML